MNRTYVIKKAVDVGQSGEYNWDAVPGAMIDCYPWSANGYKPRTEAAVIYTDSAFHICFKAFEESISIKYLKMNEPVCRDSCVEFFLNPRPDDNDVYINIETNAVGVVLIGLGKDRYGRLPVEDEVPRIFNIKSSVHRDGVKSYVGPFYSVMYTIPFDFIEKYFGKLEIKSGYRMKGNFYKCGDETAYPHYGCWNRVESKKPDFHRPECFGDMILE